MFSPCARATRGSTGAASTLGATMAIAKRAENFMIADVGGLDLTLKGKG